MTYQGQILNGVVVGEGLSTLPEGTKVTVVASAAAAPTSDTLTPAELERRRAALAAIAALADENPGDTFSGADHDSVLYEEPYDLGPAK